MNPLPLALGPLMIDIGGCQLGVIDRLCLMHPLVGGVILFARNYEDKAQLSALCCCIHELRSPPLLIAIDHEGGRVQRCRKGFALLPPMRKLGELWESDATAALDAAQEVGYVLAAELRSCGVDFSFAPVLDLNWGPSSVIGDRSFHRNPEVVIVLAKALINGMHEAGLGCCGKHFPGHGWAKADSHVAIPVDERSMLELTPDMQPYRHLQLDAVMPAHVIYPQIDFRPAGFSPVWLGKLRNEFGFDGVIFSDDLSMQGASLAGGFVERADAAWSAGCDVLLVCNAPDSVGVLLDQWKPSARPIQPARLERLAVMAPWQRDEARYAAGLAAVLKLT